MFHIINPDLRVVRSGQHRVYWRYNTTVTSVLCYILVSTLQEFSYNDWRPYCLAHLFTNQNFESNQLGLAYVASSSPSLQGGICSRCWYSCKTCGFTVCVVSLQTALSYLVVNLRGEALLTWGSPHLLTSTAVNYYSLKLNTYSLMVLCICLNSLIERSQLCYICFCRGGP